MQFLDLLGSVVEWFLGLFPHLGVMPSTHEGVRYRRGKFVSQIRPGLYLWVPAVTRIESWPVKRTTLALNGQHLTTLDGETITLCPVVVYRVMDILKALTECDDLEDTMADLTYASVHEQVRQTTFEALQSDWPQVSRAIMEELRESVRPFGIKILRIGLESLAKSRVFAHVGGNSMAIEDSEEDDG